MAALGAARGRLLLFGGELAASAAGHAGAGAFSDDVFERAAAPGAARWTQRAPAGPAPAPRGWAACASLEEGLAVHGGTAGNNARLDDMWLLRLV